MNKNYIKFNLEEAKEEIIQTIKDLETKDYSESEFSVAIMHLYHHVNHAWNARNSSSTESQECSEENYKKWDAFPKETLDNWFK